METSQLIDEEYSELIYLISDSIDNIIDLELLVENKVSDIDSNLKLNSDYLTNIVYIIIFIFKFT